MFKAVKQSLFGLDLKMPAYTPVKMEEVRHRINVHSKITMTGDVVPYYTVTALVPSLK